MVKNKNVNAWIEDSQVYSDGARVVFNVYTVNGPVHATVELRAKCFELAAEVVRRGAGMSEWVVEAGRVSYAGMGRLCLSVCVEIDRTKVHAAMLIMNQLSHDIATNVYAV